jgi:hypothetical protein
MAASSGDGVARPFVGPASCEEKVVDLDTDSDHGSENIFGSGEQHYGTHAFIVSALHAHRHEQLLVLVGLHAQALTQAARMFVEFGKPRISRDSTNSAQQARQLNVWSNDSKSTA